MVLLPLGVPAVKIVSMFGPVLVVSMTVIVGVAPSLMAVVIPAAMDRATIPKSRPVEWSAVIVIIVVIKC
jgi:hypothetical protein